MELCQVEKVIAAAPKGANIILQWVRNAKTRKGTAANIRKAVLTVGRVGIDYEKLGAVKEKRENGELPKESAGIGDWAEWVTFPYLIRHKGTGQLYLRMYSGTSDKIKPKVKWLKEGKVVPFDQVEADLLSEEKKTGEVKDCFIVKIEDLVTVGTNTENFGELFQ